MAFGAKDVQAAGLDDGVVAFLPGCPDRRDLRFVGVVAKRRHLCFPVAAQHDVRAASGHVGGDGDHAWTAGLSDDLRFAFVLFGVQHAVLDLAALQFGGEAFGGFDGSGAHQHRLARLGGGLDFLDDGIELFVLGHVDQIVSVVANHRLVGGHDDDVQAVDLLELRRFRIRRAGHAGQLAVEPEVVLQSGRRQRLRLVANRHPLLGFHRLMDAVGPAPPGHGASGVLVDDDDFAVLHHVMHVALEQKVGFQGGVNVMQKAKIHRRVEAVFGTQDAKPLEFVLHQFVAALGQLHLAVLLVHEEIAGFFRRRFIAGQHRRQARLDLLLARQLRCQLVDLHV